MWFDLLDQPVEFRDNAWDRRTLYGVLQFAADVPFALLYSGLLLFWLIAGCGDALTRRRRLRWLIPAPILAAGADVVENLLTGSMALAFSLPLPSTLVMTAATATLLKWVMVVISLLAVLVLCRRRVVAVLHHLVLVRVPLIVGGLLLLIPYLGISGPPALRSLVSELSGPGLFFACFLPVLAAAILVHSGTLTWERAPVRFQAQVLRVPQPGWNRIRFQVGLVAILSSPLILLVLRGSPEGRSMVPGMLGGLVGWVTIVLVVWAHGRWHGAIRGWFSGRLAKVPSPRENLLGPGYSDGGASRMVGEPAPLGHLFSVFLAVVLFVVYLVIGWTARPGAWLEAPSLVFVLLVLMLAAAVLSGLTFYFDRARIPVLLVVAVWVVGWQSACPRPHTVRLTEAARAEGRIPPPVRAAMPADAFAERAELLEGEGDAGAKVLTVVTATGGGIQAAAWTARVLRGLGEHPEFGDRFLRSVHLLSGVSGGAVGVYFFAEAFDLSTGLPNAAAGAKVPEKAMEPSLAATTWGIAYPDLQRTFVPWLLRASEQYRDRGWAMEQVWAEHAVELREMAGGEARASSLQDWARAASVGGLPAIVLGSTFVDDGRQAFFANVDLSKLGCGLSFEERYARFADPGLVDHYAPLPVAETEERRSCDDGPSSHVPDIDAAAAARLSATFPWITPVARIDFGTEVANPLATYHLADGGYFDNFGTFVAIQWVRHLAATGALDRYRTVLFLEINGFPLGLEAERVEGSGLGYSVLGPLKTLLAVRTSSQQSRMAVEFDLLARELLAAKQARGEGPELAVVDVRIGRSAVSTPPLSWRMSTREKAEIEALWTRWRAENAAQLVQVFGAAGALEGALAEPRAEALEVGGLQRRPAQPPG